MAKNIKEYTCAIGATIATIKYRVDSRKYISKKFLRKQLNSISTYLAELEAEIGIDKINHPDKLKEELYEFTQSHFSGKSHDEFYNALYDNFSELYKIVNSVPIISKIRTEALKDNSKLKIQKT